MARCRDVLRAAAFQLRGRHNLGKAWIASAYCWNAVAGDRSRFRCLVGPDSRVENVVPTVPDAPSGVAHAAKCLAEHPDQLDKLIARSNAVRPFDFEFAAGPVHCDDSLFQPVQ